MDAGGIFGLTAGTMRRGRLSRSADTALLVAVQYLQDRERETKKTSEYGRINMRKQGMVVWISVDCACVGDAPMTRRRCIAHIFSMHASFAYTPI